LPDAAPPFGRGRPNAIAPTVTARTLESRADTPDDRRRSDRHVVAYLAFLSALMAVSIDTALPAFDEIRDHFDLASADNRVSLIITSFFVGAAIGHLFYGPFSDRFGRGPVLRAGMIVYVLGAAGATFAPSMTMLFVFRFVWGLGAAGSGVLRVAIARDLYAGNRMARVMSVVMAVFLIAPVIAPTIGEGLVRLGGWRLTMAAPGLMAIGAIVWSFRFGETLPVERRRPLAFGPTFTAFRAVCSSPMTLGNTLALSFTFGAFYSFLGSSQPILDEIYGRGHQFAAFFAVAATAMGLVLFAGSRLMDRAGATRVGVGSLIATVTLSVGQLAVCLVTDGRPSVGVWFALIVAMICSTSLVGPTLTSLAMEPMGHMAGTASAVVGMMSTAAGAGLSALIDSQIDSTVTPMAVGFVVYGTIALGFALWACRFRTP
jgi:DHA1 family bicyclomycin/chloramphenicol resistance-like MFS transporter